MLRSAVLFGSLCLSAATLLSSCTSRSENTEAHATTPVHLEQLNVVVVTIDTLRGDDLQCYGNNKIEPPMLDQLTRRGVLFENAVA
jgi:hypothetical protein